MSAVLGRKDGTELENVTFIEENFLDGARVAAHPALLLPVSHLSIRSLSFLSHKVGLTRPTAGWCQRCTSPPSTGRDTDVLLHPVQRLRPEPAE